MISTIRNPWIRRPMVVLTGAGLFLFLGIINLMAAIEQTVRDWWEDVTGAW